MSWAKRILDSAGWRDYNHSQPSSFGKVNFDLFFDRHAVMSRLDKKEQRVLGGTGAFGRQVIRQSIRAGGKKNKRSEPGKPPRYHKRGFASLKDGIFFQAELNEGRVVIGPNKLITKTIPKGNLASGAQLLEEGGPAKGLIYKHRSDPREGVHVWVDMVVKPRPFVHDKADQIHEKKLQLLAKVDL